MVSGHVTMEPLVPEDGNLPFRWMGNPFSGRTGTSFSNDGNLIIPKVGGRFKEGWEPLFRRMGTNLFRWRGDLRLQWVGIPLPTDGNPLSRRIGSSWS